MPMHARQSRVASVTGGGTGLIGVRGAAWGPEVARGRRIRPEAMGEGYGLAARLSTVAAYNGSTGSWSAASMWYAIEGFDGPDVLPKRLAARPEHLARLTALRDEGRLLLAGPCPAIDAEDPGPAGFSGSIVIAEFASLEDARVWADADPYVAAGVYARVDVRPFKRVLP